MSDCNRGDWSRLKKPKARGMGMEQTAWKVRRKCKVGFCQNTATGDDGFCKTHHMRKLEDIK